VDGTAAAKMMNDEIAYLHRPKLWLDTYEQPSDHDDRSRIPTLTGARNTEIGSEGTNGRAPSPGGCGAWQDIDRHDRERENVSWRRDKQASRKKKEGREGPHMYVHTHNV
jgi:hypothetical protein